MTHMVSWFTPTIASGVMLIGVFPAILNVRLLINHWKKPGIVWFLLSMVCGGLWALLFAGFTLIESPDLTLTLGNFFWAVIPLSAVAMFLFAYEFASNKPVPTSVAIALLIPIFVLFVLSWSNPGGLVYSPEYYVDSYGILHFPPFGGFLKVLVVKLYGYLLVVLAAGMFIGEAIRTTGIRRRQTLYILLVFSSIALSTLVKVAELVPIYFDPATIVFSLSGVAFAVSTHRHGFLKTVPIAREQTFEEVEDAILVVGPSGTILDLNQKSSELFGIEILHSRIDDVLGFSRSDMPDSSFTVTLDDDGKEKYYSLQRSKFEYGRGARGEIFVFNDITVVKEREEDLDLFTQILTRIFRHNLRNDLMVIDGYSELIESLGDSQSQEYAGLIRSRTADLIDKTEKAREIEEIFTEEPSVHLSLPRVVDDAIATLDTTDLTGDIFTDIHDVIIEAHPKLDLAIYELVENAIEHNTERDQPEVTVRSETSTEYVKLFVEDNGPGIPPHEVNVLNAEEETDLEHGSGIGLWLVRWVIERSNGEFIFDDNDTGSKIGMQLNRVSE